MLASRTSVRMGKLCVRSFQSCMKRGSSLSVLAPCSGVKLTKQKSTRTSFFPHSSSTTADSVSYSSVAGQELVEEREDTNAETVKIIYVDRDGERHIINGKVGDNVMYLAQKHDLEVEGACEASLACCTCHVYVKDKYYDILDEPTEEEEDMLDLAPFLQENSRLSCQIILSKELEGIEVQLPSATRNFYVDGHKPKPH